MGRIVVAAPWPVQSEMTMPWMLCVGMKPVGMATRIDKAHSSRKAKSPRPACDCLIQLLIALRTSLAPVDVDRT